MMNSETRYGWVARALHWGIAVAVVAMFTLGLWMRSLDYYSAYYKTAPDIHKGVGVLLFGLMVFRLLWRTANPKPQHALSATGKKLSHIVHMLLYILLFALMTAGYFISTADGRPISVFGWFEVSAIIKEKGAERIAGIAHLWLVYTVIGIAAAHALAALHHHFVKRDGVLLSMLGRRKPEKNQNTN